jgi:AmiR/NasT family two-component response regulator
MTITEQRELISKAKARLMVTFSMRQFEAHEFIRELSMERGVKMYVIAQEILEMERLA